MMAWVASVVAVMPHSICGLAIRSVRNENGTGGSSPGCISSAAQSIERPSSRAGVPVLSRPSAQAERQSRSRQAVGRGLADAGRPGSSPRRDGSGPRRKVPVVSTTAPAADRVGRRR